MSNKSYFNGNYIKIFTNFKCYIRYLVFPQSMENQSVLYSFYFEQCCCDHCQDSSRNRDIQSIIHVIAKLSPDLNCFSLIQGYSKSSVINKQFQIIFIYYDIFVKSCYHDILFDNRKYVLANSYVLQK